jgi:tetratricopeptide (TPR) repeat protein
MRQLSIPEELALPSLLELGGLKLGLQVYFAAGYRHLSRGRYEEAVKSGEQVVSAARDDRYVTSLGHLLRAEGLRRLRRQQEAVDVVREALRWLELQVGLRAHYNESIAVYLKGCLHYSLRNEGDALNTFAYSQHALQGSANSWRIERRPDRVEDCRKLRRWMIQLVKLQTKLGAETAFILPVYDSLDRRINRIGVVPIRPFRAGIPAELLTEYFPEQYVPLMNQTVSFLSLDPEATYVAIQISEDKDPKLHNQAHKGDLLILEATNPAALRSGVELTSDDRPFVRGEGGQIEFRPVADDVEGFRGIPRLLIRGEFLTREDGVYELR